MFDFIVRNYETISLVILWIFVLWSNLKSKSTELKDKIIWDYEIRNAQLEQRLKDNQEEFKGYVSKMDKMLNDMNLEIAHLRSSNIEKDKNNVMLRELLQDKNPEVVDLLNQIKTLMTKYDEWFKETSDFQNRILVEINSRNQKETDASLKHEGVPHLVPITA